MTFKELKQEISILFNKPENEFFFTDENGCIYLDNLNVRKALFPFQNINIKNFEPMIKLIER